VPLRGRPQFIPDLVANAQGTLAMAYTIDRPDGGRLPITTVCY